MGNTKLEIPDKPEAISERGLDYQSENTCFVISPTGEENSKTRERADAVFHNIVEPAAAVSGLHCIRSDRISTSGIITTLVITHVINDRIVLADLSDRDPTVFYVLGLRHAFRKPVVQLLAFDEKLPFSVPSVRTVRYELGSAESIQAAREAAQQHIAAAMSPALDVDSPVTTAAKIEELSRSSAPQIQAMFRAIFDKELIGSAVEVRTEDILEKFADQLDLLKSVKEAGLIYIRA